MDKPLCQILLLSSACEFKAVNYSSSALQELVNVCHQQCLFLHSEH